MGAIWHVHVLFISSYHTRRSGLPPFTGIDMVSDEIPIMAAIWHVHVLFISPCRTRRSGLPPFTGIDMVSDEIPIWPPFGMCMSCSFHPVVLDEVAYHPSQVLTWCLMKYQSGCHLACACLVHFTLSYSTKWPTTLHRY